jgi:hypothetical protein
LEEEMRLILLSVFLVLPIGCAEKDPASSSATGVLVLETGGLLGLDFEAVNQRSGERFASAPQGNGGGVTAAYIDLYPAVYTVIVPLDFDQEVTIDDVTILEGEYTYVPVPVGCLVVSALQNGEAVNVPFYVYNYQMTEVLGSGETLSVDRTILPLGSYKVALLKPSRQPDQIQSVQVTFGRRSTVEFTIVGTG